MEAEKRMNFSGLSKEEYKLKKKSEKMERKKPKIIITTDISWEGQDSFYKEKAQILSKISNNSEDKSRAGDLDVAIIPFVDMINSKKDYYTTSSCAGRSLIFHKIKENKYLCDWIYLTHELECNVEEMLTNLKLKIAKNELNGETWFKMEPVIVAIQCHNVKNANTLLSLAKQSGLKNCGIRSICNDGSVSITVVDTQHVETLVVLDNVLLVNEDYFQVLAAISKQKLLKTRERFENLRKLLEDQLH
jgi:tRNA wybutosine-synthesizing protein 3